MLEIKLLIALILIALGFLLQIIAVVTKSWTVFTIKHHQGIKYLIQKYDRKEDADATMGIWRACWGSTCGDYYGEICGMEAMKAFTILSLIFAFLVLVFFVINQFLKKLKPIALINIVLSIAAFFCAFVAFLHWIFKIHPNWENHTDFGYGWSFFVSLVAWILFLIAAILFIVIKKKGGSNKVG